MEGEEDMRRKAMEYLSNRFQPSHHKEWLLNPNYIMLRVY